MEYADRLDKMIVPLQLEEGYRPDGWLGLIAGGLKSYDFSGCRPIKSELNGLLSALRKMKDEIHSDPKENTIQVKFLCHCHILNKLSITKTSIVSCVNFNHIYEIHRECNTQMAKTVSGTNKRKPRRTKTYKASKR